MVSSFIISIISSFSSFGFGYDGGSPLTGREVISIVVDSSFSFSSRTKSFSVEENVVEEIFAPLILVMVIVAPEFTPAAETTIQAVIEMVRKGKVVVVPLSVRLRQMQQRSPQRGRRWVGVLPLQIEEGQSRIQALEAELGLTKEKG